MSQELITLVNLSSHVFVYATGNLVIDATADTIAKTSAFTGITATPRGGIAQVVCASSEDAGNDGTHTLSLATASLLTTTSALTANPDDDTMVVRGKYLGVYRPVADYSRIVGIISSDQNITFTTTWSNDASGTTTVSVNTAVTGGTPASVATEILGPYVRFSCVNNATAHATASIIMYAKKLT